MVSRGGSRRPVERSSAVPLRDNLPPVKEEEEGERAAFDFLESGNLSSVRFPNPTFHIGHCKLRGGERIAGLSNFTFPSEKPTLNLKCNNFQSNLLATKVLSFHQMWSVYVYNWF